MCSREFIDKRYTTTLNLIKRTIKHTLDGAEDENGACFASKVDEMLLMIGVLRAHTNFLADVIARRDYIGIPEAMEKARKIISGLIMEQIGPNTPTPVPFRDAMLN